MAKHHYNPNFNLRRFANEQRTLWVLDKNTGRVWAKKGGRSDRYDVFAENGYNTVRYADGTDDSSVEDFYTEVEALAAPVIDSIIRVTNVDLMPAIRAIDKDNLVRFLWAQWARSPSQRLHALRDGTAEGAVDEALQDASERFGVPLFFVQALFTNNLEQIIQNAIVKAPTGPDQPDGAVFHMRRMAVDILKIPPSVEAHFITSDRSCLVEPIRLPGGYVFMPISQNVSIQLTRPEDSSGVLASVGARTVERINKAILNAALRYIAGPSAEHLSALNDAVAPVPSGGRDDS